jgi:hypothetical protein
MTSIPFDTPRYAKRPEQAGFWSHQVEGAAAALAGAIGDAIARNSDIKDLRSAIRELELHLIIKAGVITVTVLGSILTLSKTIE